MVALFDVLEEVAVDRGPQPGEGPLLVPPARDGGGHDRRSGVVGVRALDPQVQRRPARTASARRVRALPAERAGTVGVTARGQRRQVPRQQVVGQLVGVGEPDRVALHVRHAVGGVREPDDHLLAARRPPPERPGQLVAPLQVRQRTARPSCAPRRGANPGGVQRVDHADDRARHVGVHGRLGGEAVLLLELRGEAELPVELLGRAGFGVQLERQRGHLDDAGAGQRGEPGDLVGRPGVEPLQRGHRRLDRPPELGRRPARRRSPRPAGAPRRGSRGGGGAPCPAGRCSRCRGASDGRRTRSTCAAG